MQSNRGISIHGGFAAVEQVLPDALQSLEKVVTSCEKDVALEACSCIQEVLASSDDYARKILFVRWYTKLASACLNK
jgi:hypothetical protein